MADAAPAVPPSPSSKTLQQADRLRQFWNRKTQDMDIDADAPSTDAPPSPAASAKHDADDAPDAPDVKRAKSEPEPADSDVTVVIDAPSVDTGLPPPVPHYCLAEAPASPKPVTTSAHPLHDAIRSGNLPELVSLLRCTYHDVNALACSALY